jgi:hypothetical protein
MDKRKTRDIAAYSVTSACVWRIVLKPTTQNFITKVIKLFLKLARLIKSRIMKTTVITHTENSVHFSVKNSVFLRFYTFFKKISALFRENNKISQNVLYNPNLHSFLNIRLIFRFQIPIFYDFTEDLVQLRDF